MDAPTHYALGYDDQEQSSMDAIVDDLKSTLPTILSKVTLEDLEAVENEQGARSKAEGCFGPTYAQQVEVSCLSDPDAG